jgi:hypothetical protein
VKKLAYRWAPMGVVLVVAWIAARLIPDHRSCGSSPWWVWAIPGVIFVAFYAYLRYIARKDRHANPA